jgi:uncharacterized protein YacL (UPF0231 family)
MLDDMEIEFTKPTSEAAELQAMFDQTDKETISLLMKEVEELYAKLEAWQKCADRLFVYAMETLSTATNIALYEAAKEVVLEYNRLKISNESEISI